MADQTAAATARILVPAAYLDALRADPHPDMPPATRALLLAAEIIGQPSTRRAIIDVPAADVPGFAAVARAHFDGWGDEHIRRRTMPAQERDALARRARAAYMTLVQLQRHQEG